MDYPGNTTPQNPDDLELTAKKILLGLNKGTWSGGGGGGGGTVRVFALTAAVTSGAVNTGSRSVAFSSSPDFAGTIAGATFGPSQALGVSADGADTIGSITYTRSAGTLYIATLT